MTHALAAAERNISSAAGGKCKKKFITILEMVDMILDGCKSIDEAKEKVEKLIRQRKKQKEKNE